jgi:3-deoxy-D-manno-octulosonic acid kinase
MHPQYIRQERAFIVYDADTVDDAAAASGLFQPQTWLSAGRAREVSGGRGGVVFLRSAGGEWALRHYWRGGLIRHLSNDRYIWLGLQRTRPWHEWHLLSRLFAAGLPVPRPIAARVLRPGPLLYTGDLVTEVISDVRPLSQVLRTQALPPQSWEHLGTVLMDFQRAGVLHADLNANNVMCRGQGQFFLLDFDRARTVSDAGYSRRPLQRLRHSLRKLRRHQEAFRFTDADWACVLRGAGLHHAARE